MVIWGWRVGTERSGNDRWWRRWEVLEVSKCSLSWLRWWFLKCPHQNTKFYTLHMHSLFCINYSSIIFLKCNGPATLWMFYRIREYMDIHHVLPCWPRHMFHYTQWVGEDGYKVHKGSLCRIISDLWFFFCFHLCSALVDHSL